ncbi:MAG: tetratricopeptide repeat protein, partial [Hyphomicrobiales bacterium]
MNRIDRLREAKLKRQQNFDIDKLRENDPDALKAAIGAIDLNMREGRTMKARKLCAHALTARPDSAELNYAMGVIHQSQNDFDKAISSYQTAVSIDPQRTAGWINVGICCRAKRDHAAALKAFDKAIAADPSSFHAYYNRGLLHCDRKDMAAALTDLERAVELRSDIPEAHYQLGFLRELAQDHDKAISSYGKSLEIDRNNPAVHTNLGACLQMVGQFDLAAEHLHSAIALQPDNGRAHYLLACSDQAQTDAETLARLDHQLHRPELAPAARIYMHFAAGRLHERTGDYDAAFIHYRSGNELRGAGYRFDREAIGHLPGRIAGAFPQDLFARHEGAGNPSTRPVFVVGMPRSGTTLIEQIIASHPDAYGAGELANLTDIGAVPGPEAGPGNDYPANVPA